MKRKITEIIQPFTTGQIQDTLTLMGVLAAEGYGLPALERYMAAMDEVAQGHRARQAAESASFRLDVEKHLPKCPECGQTMAVIPVNDRPGNQIGGTAKSMWLCPDLMGCGFAVESVASAMEEIQKTGIRAPYQGHYDPMPPLRRPGPDNPIEAERRRARAAGAARTNRPRGR